MKELDEVRRVIAKVRASESQHSKTLTAKAQKEELAKLVSFRAEMVRKAMLEAV